MRHLLPCLLAFLIAAPAFAQREYGFDNRKASGQEYLSPDETVKRMKVAPEFEVKLFAGEPNCVNPIAFTIDEKGRVWVVECFEYPSRTPKGKAPRDRIVILEDTDGDGACDKRTVFAEGKDFPVSDERKKAGLGAFDLASGIEVGNGGVYVGAPPYLWFIENKDDKPGKFETVLKGFGSEDTHETLNTFQWGPDGWLYGLHGVFTQSNVKPLDGPETRMNAAVWRFHPKTKKFEIFAEGTSNPWGMDWRNTDGQFILACCVIPHLYHIVPGGIYKRQAGASFNPYAYGEIKEICDHTFHKESGWAHAGLISLDAPHIPEKYRNSVIFGSIHGCSVKQNILKPNGSSYTASKGDDFLVSGDKNFRPINMKWGPNGDIYLIDWHDQNPCHQAKAEDWDYERGRVYRIQLKGAKTKKAENFGAKSPEDLLALRNDPNPYTYRTALRLLSALDRPTRAKIGTPLVSSDAEIRDWWALGYMGSGKPPAIHSDGGLEGEWSGPTEKKYEWLVRVVGESDLQVPSVIGTCAEAVGKAKSASLRRELASAAVRLADKHDVSELVRALMKHKEDAADPLIPHLTWLAYEKVLTSRDRQGAGGEKEEKTPLPGGRGSLESELAFLAKEAPDNIFVRDQIVPKVMRRLVATGQPDDLKLCVKFLADVTDTSTREKALDGLTVALAGQVVDAPDAWAKLQPDLRKEPRLVGFVNKLSVSFRDPEALKRAYAAVHDLKLPTAVRAEALQQVVLLRHPDALPLVNSLLRQEQDVKVRAEAARQLVAFPDPKVGESAVRDWKMFPAEVRGDVVNSLASRKEWAKALLKALDAKVIDRTAVTDNAITRMQAFNDREINTLIEKAWGRVRKTPDELNKLIDKTRDSLYAAPASFANGRKVFEAQCAKCHKFDGKGNEVGPQLDGAGRDIEYLLANVLDPNRVIGAPYFVRTATLLDGQIIQGVLAAEDDQSITLKVENAVLKRIARKDLDGPVKVAKKSMMPEGLAAGVSEQDFRDLVRYVMASPFLTHVAVNGKPVSVGVPGRIPLPKPAGAVTITAEFTAAAALRTKLLVGASDPFTVKLDGKEVGKGEGTSKRPQPDTEGFDVELPAGKHTLTITVASNGATDAVFARFLDPDRKLSYPER
jgi:putative membrane-bound dehydrogenase-like protein